MTIWQHQRHGIMVLGQALHEGLPTGEPPVTIHGRELEPETEGVGFQFQLTMSGDLYGGQFTAGYFVVQVQLIKRKAGLGWLVDAMPILEIAHGNYDLYPKRVRELAFRELPALETYMLQYLAQDAAQFFAAIRNEQPPAEKATAFGGGRTEPVL